MKLHNLTPALGSVHKAKRLGRGEASGKGGTSTKGNKGSQARTGYKLKMAFEGGQMPIQRRIPKRGFSNFAHKTSYRIFNLGQLQEFIESYKLEEITNDVLYIHGFIQKGELVKILGQGEFKSKINFKIDGISQKAKDILEGLGCVIEMNKK
ncbi:MAG: 50S ribosomal protein L15 [Alphaproteobacteria bacterium]|nr:50S ribosomal protein L15 [Alphaproteobacteria bacterium]